MNCKNNNRFSVMFNGIVILVLQCLCCFPPSGFVMGYVGEEAVILGELDVTVPVPGSNVKGGVSGCHLTTEDPDADCIPGRGGADYPLHWQVPLTHFQCTSQQYPGYYADTEAQCQVFHICQFDGRQDSFLCPNGTVFHQKYFTCEWWYNVNCGEAQHHYVLNAYLYQEPSVSFVQRPESLPPALPVAPSPSVTGPPSPTSITIVQQPSPLRPVLPTAPPSVSIVQQPSPIRPVLPVAPVPGLPSPPSVSIVQQPSPIRPVLPVAPPSVPIVQQPSPIRPVYPVAPAPVSPTGTSGLPSPPSVAIVQQPSPLHPVPVSPAVVPPVLQPIPEQESPPSEGTLPSEPTGY